MIYLCVLFLRHATRFIAKRGLNRKKGCNNMIVDGVQLFTQLCSNIIEANNWRERLCLSFEYGMLIWFRLRVQGQDEVSLHS